jgi:hypothetical protein
MIVMRERLRFLAVAGMICCLAGTILANIYVYETSQPPQWPAYSYPVPPMGWTWIKVPSGPLPQSNPLKGFMPYASPGLSFPHSMEYSYFPLNSIAGNSTGVFNFSIIDDFLDQVACRGHQAVFRIYLDYPSLPTGVPQYLIDEGVVMRPYTDYGGGLSPDYDNPLVVAELVSFVHALGARYDGDPRIGFIEAGLLGFWGEWHTYPHTDWFANETTQRAVLQAYQDSFNKTWILARYASNITADYRVGFHDDSFASDTIFELDEPNSSQSFLFWNQMISTGLGDIWQQAPIGGEVYPPFQASVFRSPQVQGQDFNACIITTHASWMLDTEAFYATNSWSNISDADLQRALHSSQAMGYDLKACWVNYSYAPASMALSVSVIVGNFGVAPFYYNWTAQFGVFNQTGVLMQQYNTSESILGILPGQYAIWNATLSNIQPSDSGCSIGVRVPNVLAGAPPVLFSNQNVTADGWTMLCGLNF